MPTSWMKGSAGRASGSQSGPAAHRPFGTRAGPGEAGRRNPPIALDLAGRQVLTARAMIDRPSWSVFVEQPLEEAFAPLYALLGRTALVLLGGLALSVLASLILARRMTQPIRQLQAGAAHIGSGGLDYRIDVRTGDELEVLGDAFNDMTGRLQESYATLEQKVDERTRDLAEALQRLTRPGRGQRGGQLHARPAGSADHRPGARCSTLECRGWRHLRVRRVRPRVPACEPRTA